VRAVAKITPRPRARVSKAGLLGGFAGFSLDFAAINAVAGDSV